MKFYALFVIILTSLCQCSTKELQSNADLVPPVDPKQYATLLEKFTKAEEQFKGINNSLKISATLMNSDVSQAVLQKKGHFLQWDMTKARQERAHLVNNLSRKTQFFVSFYTPNPSDNNLDKTPSLWEIYLDVDGVRYNGTAKKDNTRLAQRAVLFPSVNRWNKSYVVSFSVPMEHVEPLKSKLTITGAIGQSELIFRP